MVGGLLGSYDDPRKAGLLAMAANLMASSGPSLTPTTLSQGIGNALMGGQRQALAAGGMAQRSRELDQREAVRGLQERQFESGLESQRERSKMIMDYAQTLPPQLRMPFLLNPEEFMKSKVVQPGGVLANGGGATFTNPPKPPAPSAFTQLILERDALPPGDPRRKFYDDRIAKETSHQPPTQVSVPVNLSGNEYAKAVGKQAAERDLTAHDRATSGVENVAKLAEVTAQLESGDAITGMGAEVFLEFERAKALFLNDKKAGKKVADTEYLRSLLGSDVFPMIKSMGVGARGLDTPAEREFMIGVLTGSIPLNKETLLRMTKMRMDREVKAIESWNNRVERGELDRFFEAQGIEKSKIDVPKVTQGKKVVRRGTFNNRPVVEYADGTVEYAD